jgi:outer membrane autotransporter protein
VRSLKVAIKKEKEIMKKLAIASLIALATTAASALEVGVTTTRDYSGTQNRNGSGITVGERVGKVGVTGGFERFTKGSNDQDRYSLVVGYDVAKIGSVTIAPKVGAAYLDNQTGQDGYAATVGAGASLPLTKQVSLGVDFARQMGQKRVEQFDGNRVNVGLTYKF